MQAPAMAELSRRKKRLHERIRDRPYDYSAASTYSVGLQETILMNRTVGRGELAWRAAEIESSQGKCDYSVS